MCGVRDSIIDQELVSGSSGHSSQPCVGELTQQCPRAATRAGAEQIVGVVDTDEKVHTGQRANCVHGLTTSDVTSRTHRSRGN